MGCDEASSTGGKGWEDRYMGQLRLTRRRALLSAGAVALAACDPSTSGPGASATSAAGKRAVAPFKFLFGFTVQANPSMPVIIAKEQGYYREEDIDISWDFTTDSTSIRLIGANQYQAGSVSDVLTVSNFVNEGIPLKAISQQGQASARAFAVKKDSGIKRPKDFEGKKVGIKSGAPWAEYLAMLAFDKADRSKIKEVPVGFSSVELKDGTVDVLPIFGGNEPFVLKNQIKVDRDAMIRFMKATMKAQEFFIAERDKTIQIAIQYGGTATTKEQHAFIYDVSAPDMKHPKGVGFIDKDVWQKNIDILSDLGLLKTKPKVDDLVDSSIMETVLKDGKVVYP